MDWRNRIGLYGSYFLGMAGIGFTLPYLPLFLGLDGLSDRAIGLISTLAALAGLAQFPAGLWSDRLGTRKPFILLSLAALGIATVLLRGAHGAVWLGVLVVLFAENGICRATVESLAGAEATALALPGQTAAALGALRFWKPVGIIAVAGVGSVLAKRYGVRSILGPLAVVQLLAAATASLIHEPAGAKHVEARPRKGAGSPMQRLPRDAGLWAFVAAMVLFHTANAPGGVYLGLFLKRDLHASEDILAYAFIVSMIVWMLVVWPAGWLADRCGRKPLLVAGWTVMALRLALVAVAQSPAQIVAIQALDGLANGLFAVLAAAWVTDRLADPRRMGEAQVIVGTSLVLGSAIGPAVAGLLVGSIGYRVLFGVLAGVGALATLLVVAFVPETVTRHREVHADRFVEPMATLTDLSTTP
ncbi:MAG: MFS transporter [Isosphaeraceae bacterium]|nr:MFS transporter [Isosphaeraceae bacterium]